MASFRDTLELVGQRWTGAILRELMNGQWWRFSEVTKAVPGLSDRLLMERLRLLEAQGLVERNVKNRRTVWYRITPKGRQVRPLIAAAEDVARRWS